MSTMYLDSLDLREIFWKDAQQAIVMSKGKILCIVKSAKLCFAFRSYTIVGFSI